MLLLSESEEEVTFEVKEILGHRKSKGRWEFEVEWEGFDETTWEPQAILQNNTELAAYLAVNKPLK